MKLKTKLAWGLGFLFLIIFVLVFLSSYYVQKLGQESKNILKDNYDSLNYAKNMFYSLDDMNVHVLGIFAGKRGDYSAKVFDSARSDFDKNLAAESGNITEIHEAEYVETLKNDYALYLIVTQKASSSKDGASPAFAEYVSAYEKLRQSINNINDVNMQAVVRKSQSTILDSSRIANLMAIIGAFCLLLALAYIWYFPFYVSNSGSTSPRKWTDC